MNNLNVAKIQLNGSSYEVNDRTNLEDLLNKLKTIHILLYKFNI